MIEVASQIVLCLVIAAVIGFLMGLIIGKSFGNSKKREYNDSTSYQGKAKGNVYNKPLIRSNPRPTGKDDLKAIEGIDLKMEDKLNELGIYHFDQIAKWNDKNCEWIEYYFTLEDSQIKENNWVEQAKSLSKLSV